MATAQPVLAPRIAPSTPGARPLKAAPRRAPLQVVRPDTRIRTAGAIGTTVLLIIFTTLFVLAAVHAVLVQGQAQIDAINAQNVVLETTVTKARASLAAADSPEGLAAQAAAAGLVESGSLVMLMPVADGALATPTGADPFGSGVDR
ncbi:MAG: hypothetical protein HOH36_12820 [Acidimicrobiaceae bacterium]|jgi:hypothetical protein|nr:hypothetical protein [Acidimicrobiaceae bacterium]MBT5581397.1 hypothetical protein [Acidimicrobiaceae bacterium]MBT5851311.1 hypothetical protein [Acidimicrobiaceae bacterium]